MQFVIPLSSLPVSNSSSLKSFSFGLMFSHFFITVAGQNDYNLHQGSDDSTLSKIVKGKNNRIQFMETYTVASDCCRLPLNVFLYGLSWSAMLEGTLRKKPQISLNFSKKAGSYVPSSNQLLGGMHLLSYKLQNNFCSSKIHIEYFHGCPFGHGEYVK